MNIEIWLAFCVTSIVLLTIPGPTVLTVISYSLSHGHRVKIPLIMAVALADCTALGLSLLGLGVLLAESVFWFQLVKWAGGIYLLFLGVKLLMSGIKFSAIEQENNRMPSWKLFLNTYLVTALNPKGIIFFVAYFPQFINTNADATQQLWLLATTFILLSALNTTVYVVYAGKARQAMSSPRTRRGFNVTGGSLLSGAGLWALLAKQP